MSPSIFKGWDDPPKSIAEIVPRLYRAYAAERERLNRVCYFCGEPIRQQVAIRALTDNAWAHFSCWYDGPPGVKDANGEIV
jgi:pyruvate-formate lyase-activating enzyme